MILFVFFFRFSVISLSNFTTSNMLNWWPSKESRTRVCIPVLYILTGTPLGVLALWILASLCLGVLYDVVKKDCGWTRMNCVDMNNVSVCQLHSLKRGEAFEDKCPRLTRVYEFYWIVSYGLGYTFVYLLIIGALLGLVGLCIGGCVYSNCKNEAINYCDC
jgi:hypothetical protein